MTPARPAITEARLIAAFTAARLATTDRPIRFVTPLHRRRSAWRAEIALPRAVTAAWASRRRDAVAAHLGIPAADVALDATGDPPWRNVLIYIFDPDPNSAVIRA